MISKTGEIAIRITAGIIFLFLLVKLGFRMAGI
jgi:hypothetical protein